MTSAAPAGPPCAKCGHENPESVQFCTRCHAVLRYACPSCHHLQPHGGKCGACGVDFVEHETTQLRLARERAAAKPGPRVSQEMLVTIAGVTLLVLAVGAWWAVKPLFDAARPNAARPVAVRAPAAPSAPAVPSARAAPEAQPAADVLRALQGLRALVQGRGSYVEYGPRAFDAKKAVDRYVNTPGGDAELKRGARETMDLYMLAATAWNAALRADAGDEQGAAPAFVSVSRDPALDFCPAAREARDNAKADATVPLDVVQGMGVVSAVPAIFACAESRLAEVERRMTGR